MSDDDYTKGGSDPGCDETTTTVAGERSDFDERGIVEAAGVQPLLAQRAGSAAGW